MTFRDFSFLVPTGIRKLSTTKFTIYAKRALTGLELILITDPSFPERSANDLLTILYSSYTDFVLKDPFYTIDMPIRSTLFDRAVRQTLGVTVP
jgi:hypothetical protein